ncbi:hypothetical protein [Cellulomonas sp. S1-8]|uniref:hypothetical protein n=1 Tax=Cellulomonas sp. S1-8 TaxID=2904790 RepID=UPI002243D26E|nr:hypothetical protein [Cellulomonas sp. S1-8]UZN03099.1 hypothetical protein OKX07_18925 [Cellulomonas sp. S1-8]
MLSRRHARLAPALVLLLGALTACAGGATADAGTSPVPLAPAPDAVLASPEVTGPATLTADDFIRTVVDAQVTAQSYDFTLSLGSGDELMAMNGSMHLGGGSPSFAMFVLMPDAPPMTIRSVAGMNYVSLGDVTGGKFLAVDPQDTSHPLTAVFADSMSQVDPTMGLGEQEAAVVSVTPDGGPVDLDGTQVQRYEVVVDPSKMPEKLAQLEAGLPPGMEVPETLTYTYVVDTEGRIQMVTFDVLGIRGRMGFSNWGSGTPVEAPTAEEITTEDPFTG